MTFIKKPFVQRCMKCLVCFFLIVALSINAIPRPVSASAVAGAVTYGLVSAPLVIDAIAHALGFLPYSSYPSDFAKLKTQIYDTLYSIGWIFDGAIKVGLATTAGGMSKTYVPLDLIQAVRSAIFGTGSITVVSVPFSQVSPYIHYRSAQGFSMVNYYSGASTSVYWVAQYCGLGAGPDQRKDAEYYQVFAVSSSSFSYTYSFGKETAVKFTDLYFAPVGSFYTLPGSDVTGLPVLDVKQTDVLSLTSSDFSSGRLATYDSVSAIEFGSVAAPSVSIADGYSDWYSSAISDPDDDQPLLPVGIPGVSLGNTQSGAQTGDSSESIVDSIVSNPSVPGTGDVSGTISNTSSITSINSWVRTISDTFDNLIDWVIDIYNLLVDALDLSAIIEWLESLGLTLSEILEWIIALPASIAESIADVISAIFVPSADYVTEKVESIESRFAWVTPIVDYIDTIKNEMLGASVPIIYIHLGDSEGSYNIGGTVPFLDMTWYSRYKESGDAIISGFLWALFLWRLYIKLPSIINGAGGDIGHFTIRSGKDYDI